MNFVFILVLLNGVDINFFMKLVEAEEVNFYNDGLKNLKEIENASMF